MVRFRKWLLPLFRSEFFLSPRSTPPISWLVLAAVAVLLLAPYAGCHILTSAPSDPSAEQEGPNAGPAVAGESPQGRRLNDLDALLGQK